MKLKKIFSDILLPILLIVFSIAFWVLLVAITVKIVKYFWYL